MSHLKTTLRIVGAVCLAVMLSGCVIEPAWGPGGYYHHARYWGH